MYTPSLFVSPYCFPVLLNARPSVQIIVFLTVVTKAHGLPYGGLHEPRLPKKGTRVLFDLRLNVRLHWFCTVEYTVITKRTARVIIAIMC